MAKQGGSEPDARFRVGYVEAAVWKTDNGFYSVKLSRSYKDGDGKIKNTEYLGHGDLLNAAKVLHRAEAWISEQ